MNISDTFYVALCMTILIIGVVYWFWTQNQYIQRKLNLLENIVYEMKTNFNNSPESGEPAVLNKVDYPPAPSSELGDDDDILHEELRGEIDEANERVGGVSGNSSGGGIENENRGGSLNKEMNAPVAEYVETSDVLPYESEKNNDQSDLQPGGVGSSLAVELPADSTGSGIDTMTLKELKRLAEQRKIPGSSTMRKQALIDALRNGVTKESVNTGDIDIHEIDLN